MASRGDDPRAPTQPSRIDLPIKPNRCDDHAFMESGGATAFKIGLHLDGEPGQITLRMSVPGAKNAIDFAKASCGDLSTVSGGVTGRLRVTAVTAKTIRVTRASDP